ncbi:rhodanese-like domain-containing protein [Pseudoalteromonas byunsanensis]|uniref:Rhodanese-like domain-containing protein n=1 Tax=Pseudoalteromonas byunsanensis TaxID=327939 RepID=A0A1S1NC34_9GAMM|nr:rhodanese-like domain-containing protein [Pseudoalteromonas byunsanensis]OHU97298.1 rhodanese-like domain-containing protein [Pseudoalteromonas byunsanensis]
MVSFIKTMTILLLIYSCQIIAQQSIAHNELLINQMSDQAHIIVDVRSAEEFAQGHIKGAINIPFNQIEQHENLLEQYKSSQLVVYCRSGRRAGIFIESLAPKGFNLLHLEGDMNAWLKANLPVITGPSVD